MLQRYFLMFQPMPVVCVVLFNIMILGFGEMLAESVQPGGFSETPDHHVYLAVRSFALPNYWIWYDKKAVHEVIEAQGLDIKPFILTTAYNAALSTSSVFVGNTMVLMFLLIRTVKRNSAVNWLWLVPFLSFLCDMAEDIFLLVIVIGYPYIQYPTLMWLLPWCSFLKYLGWFITLVLYVVLFVKWQLCGVTKDSVE